VFYYIIIILYDYHMKQTLLIYFIFIIFSFVIMDD